MTDEKVKILSRLKGIEPEYIDAWGKEACTSQETVKKILDIMGYPESELDNLLEQEIKGQWFKALAPVTVFRESTPWVLTLCLPIEFVNDDLNWVVLTELGGSLSGQLTPVDGQLVAVETIEEGEFQVYQLEFDADLPQGYHQLSLYEAGVDEPLGETRLIVAPQACYSPEAIQQGKKIWGTSVQLYGLKSERNWGIGDFSDLKLLLEHTSQRGGDFVGLNPIHALYPSLPENASPYSPSSRKWLNILYIDVEIVPEFKLCPPAKERVASADFQQELAQLRKKEWVDYTGVTKAKLEVLSTVYQTFATEQVNSERFRQFKAFVAAAGESLQTQALYDALSAEFIGKDQSAWGWPVWPQEFQDFSSERVQQWSSENTDKVAFWTYLQWLAQEQLGQADKLANNLKMELGIYRDLAVGVAQGSSEIWANREIYCPDASIGAPPDILGPLGQNWGLPPLDPVKLRESGYQAFIDLLQANMSHCGALRIDHVMALLRLWWVPRGDNADKGVYVYYPVEELLAILSLESHRRQCLVIGEDLGTVPDGMEELLKDNGVYSYRVFFFEQADDGGFISPSHYPRQSMATLSTHDMPTIKGFWHCDDLQLGRELGLYPNDEILSQLTADRHQAKQRLLDSLHGHHAISDDVASDVNLVGMDQALNFGMQIHMATGAAALLSLQLEDFLQMDKPVNVPGTSDEYPNWRRKLSHTLEALFSKAEVNDLTQKITQARREAQG